MDGKKKVRKISDEQRYLNALVEVKQLPMKVIENYEQGDDEVSHFFEDLYDVLDKAIPM
jgi:hypothetical protein